MNAMPHFIMGITKTKFLGLFGFSPKANIAYSIVQLVICLLLFHWKYGIAAIVENGMFVGALFILLGYYIFGKVAVTIYKNGFSLNTKNKQEY